MVDARNEHAADQPEERRAGSSGKRREQRGQGGVKGGNPTPWAGERGRRGDGGERANRTDRPGPSRQSPEALVAQLLVQVVTQGQSLDVALGRILQQAQPTHRGLVQAMGYEVLRHYEALVFWRDQLLERPVPAKSAVVAFLILVGLERIRGARREASRSVNATVQAARELGHPWATGLLNAVLRRAARQIEEGQDPMSSAPAAVQARMPDWLFARLTADWGADQAGALGEALASHPPMTLRIAGRETDRASYLDVLAATDIAATPTDFSPRGVNLQHPLDVDRLPQFAEGRVSVQDEAAQWVVDLLDLSREQRVLDACSAPGGKTLAMLQHEPGVHVTAVDIDLTRMARVQENLERGKVVARLIVGDAAQPSAWWDGEPFDRILADVPCSATGVIRRHPDIKRLRRADDLAPLCARQASILDALWPLLRSGGRMVYATCSILNQENAAQVAAFLDRHPDARALPMNVSWGIEQRDAAGRTLGRQVFPQREGHDGFYYAVLEKA
ncbi:16S rRNA (cytosine(967)-C(5))-methyltransferase RsmB [Halothiobacillus diazotrophicus]|uniref:16S rRNA (cytosine(967)-C(5))-methyltransferase RsmB n=1 Tax=Halothiobacillus diazotrophicus TaxID=1860122 RepID=UPI0018D407A4|nr:16S rRNA (cytosine(967)-C(5))-methyltransferase RsmB [Halothiobacillus diazotrophicus]